VRDLGVRAAVKIRSFVAIGVIRPTAVVPSRGAGIRPSVVLVVSCSSRRADALAVSASEGLAAYSSLRLSKRLAASQQTSASSLRRCCRSRQPRSRPRPRAAPGPACREQAEIAHAAPFNGRHTGVTEHHPASELHGVLRHELHLFRPRSEHSRQVVPGGMRPCRLSPAVIGYVTIGTNDLGRAVSFYDRVLSELGG
jgi:hypothetical protein